MDISDFRNNTQFSFPHHSQMFSRNYEYSCLFPKRYACLFFIASPPLSATTSGAKVLPLFTNNQAICSYDILPLKEQLSLQQQQHKLTLEKTPFGSLHSDKLLAEMSLQMKKYTNKELFKFVPSLLII